MKFNLAAKRASSLVTAMAALGMGWSSAASATGAEAYTAEATVVDAKLTVLSGLIIGPLNVKLVEAGPIPTTGGLDMDTLVTIPKGTSPNLNASGNVAQALAAASRTITGPSRSIGYASVNDLAVNAGGLGASLGITADTIQANAESACDSNEKTSAAGGSIITNLRINGQLIPVSGQPNQKYDLPGIGTLIINEQISNVNQDAIFVATPLPLGRVKARSTFTANALHIKIGTSPALSAILGGDIIIAHAKAGTTCFGRKPGT